MMDRSNGEVFILGAGFSRAISEHLPLTDELGNLVLERDPDHLGRSAAKLHFSNGTFESWLSRRGEPQPYLSAAENLGSQAVFARGTNLIAEVLDERVANALEMPMPTWLGELISLWHLRKSNVLTFNYDPLIECAFQTMNFFDWRAQSHFQWGSLINYSPAGKAGSSYGEVGGKTAPHSTFRLWKLHGSLNWHWVPGDETGATVLRGRLPGGFGEPNPVSSDELNWSAPGRERFIVPPAALKSGYYGNPVTRAIWRQSYQALSQARSITLMGYSIPPTDLSTSGMLAEALVRATETKVRVVDFNPGTSADSSSILCRVRALRGSTDKVESIGAGTSAIPEYVSRLLEEAASEVIQGILELRHEDDPALFVDWGEYGAYSKEVGRSAAVIRVQGPDASGVVTLDTEQLARWPVTHRARRPAHEVSVPEPVPLSLSALEPYLRTARSIRLRVPGVERLVAVIDTAEVWANGGHGNGHWVQLVPAGFNA